MAVLHCTVSQMIDSFPSKSKRLRDCRAALSSGGEEFDDIFNRFVGAVIGGFETALGPVLRIGAMVEAAVGERSAQPFVEQQKEQCDLRFKGLVKRFGGPTHESELVLVQ